MQRGENENGVAWAAKLCAMIPEKWHLIEKPIGYRADECERVLGAVWDGIREAGADPAEEFAAESAK